MDDMNTILNSPLIVALVTVSLTSVLSAAAAVIGLFIKVASLATTIRAIAKDVSEIASDKDIMRWSAWAPAHERREYGREIERKR